MLLYFMNIIEKICSVFSNESVRDSVLTTCNSWWIALSILPSVLLLSATAVTATAAPLSPRRLTKYLEHFTMIIRRLVHEYIIAQTIVNITSNLWICVQKYCCLHQWYLRICQSLRAEMKSNQIVTFCFICYKWVIDLLRKYRYNKSYVKWVQTTLCI